jgi:hypothetical protein
MKRCGVPDLTESVGRRLVLKALAAIPFLRAGRAAHADVVARIERFMAAAHTPNPYWPDRRKNQPAANG